MTRRLLFVAVLVLWAAPAAPAWALLDPLALIEQDESGGRNIQQQVVPLSVSSASGLYQITTTTWNTDVSVNGGLPQVGAGTAYPNGVMDLSPGIQQQGAALLYNEHGFTPWTCPGCNNQLARDIAAQGGTSAFTPQGSLDPVNGDSFVGQIVGDPGGAAAAVPAGGGAVGGGGLAVAQLQTPFTSAYNVVSNIVLNKIAALGENARLLAASIFLFIVAWAYMKQGAAIWFGQQSFESMMWFTFKALFVMSLIFGVSWQSLGLIQFFTITLPQWIASGFGGAQAGANPAANYDAAALNLDAIIIGIKQGGAWYDLFLPLILGGCWFIIIVVLCAMFAPFIYLTAAIVILITITPLLLMGVAFNFTRKYLDAAFDIAVFVALGLVVVDMFTQIFVADITQQLASVPLNAGSWTAAMALGLIIVHIVLVGMTIGIGWWITKKITNTVGMPISLPVPHAVAAGAVQRVMRWA